MVVSACLKSLMLLKVLCEVLIVLVSLFEPTALLLGALTPLVDILGGDPAHLTTHPVTK
jgi:hypothetical protein